MSEHTSDPRASSRRAFLAAVGATAGAGVVSDAAAATRRPSSGELAVMRSPTLRPLSADDPPLDVAATASVNEADAATGFERLAAGETDVLHASRPMLPEEARAAAANGVGYDAIESAVDGIALLARSERGWRSPLGEDLLDRRLRENSDVQVWSELADPDAGVGAATTRAIDGDGGRAADLPSSGSLLVRGVRAEQYATGFGGLGYYDASATELTPVDGSDERRSYTPLARLRYTYVRDGAIPDGTVRTALRSSTSRARSDGPLAFADPDDRRDAVGTRAVPLGERVDV